MGCVEGLDSDRGPVAGPTHDRGIQDRVVLTDQDPEGWIIEGFDNRATIATYYNFEWMPCYIEEMGYAKDIDYYVYKSPVPKEDFPGRET